MYILAGLGGGRGQGSGFLLHFPIYITKSFFYVVFFSLKTPRNGTCLIILDVLKKNSF